MGAGSQPITGWESQFITHGTTSVDAHTTWVLKSTSRKMRRLSVFLLVLLSMMAVHATDNAKSRSSEAAKVTQAPEMDDDNDDEEDEMGGLGWCKEDQRVAAICIACAQLPAALSLPPSECCSDADALEICKNCVDDPVRCLRDVLDIVTDGDRPQHEEEAMRAYDKRYGMLFFGQKPKYVPPKSDYVAEKRFGTLNLGNMGKRLDDQLDGELDKRWGSLGLSKRYGTLNLGSYFNKRYGMLGLGNRYLGYLGSRDPNMGKRFGTLNLGGLYSDMGKRYGTLNIGKESDLLSESELGKRYGTLNLGKRYGTLSMGSGSGPLSLGKRYGTLGMSNTFGYFPYKRSEYVPYNGAIGTDMKKRYGRLFMGRFGGKRLNSANEIRISQIRK
ncbi:uncharacterized protein LOC124119827 [Haliotis rufescens]|uniref:uncharacterized protein LOC124119827 n=1 Tax=Haliotis rufescens TaxID=6454 RepID=UPI001EB04B85|nr:uncharacterized protein LOC124119827 [Haliotis rufescens]